MIKHKKEQYPGVNSPHVHLHMVTIELEGEVVASLRAIGASIRDSWADPKDEHPYETYSNACELEELFEGIFGYSVQDTEKEITSYGLRDELLDALDVLPGGLRIAERMDPLPNILYVDNLYVCPSQRGHGLAGRLLVSLKNLSRQYDAVFLEASPFVSDFEGKKAEQLRLRAKLRSLYERNGFVSVEGDFPYMLATFSALAPQPRLRKHPVATDELGISI